MPNETQAVDTTVQITDNPALTGQDTVEVVQENPGSLVDNTGDNLNSADTGTWVGSLPATSPTADTPESLLEEIEQYIKDFGTDVEGKLSALLVKLRALL